MAEKAFQNVIIRLVQRQQLFTAVHESYNKDDDGHDERHHGEAVHGEVDHDTAVAPTERSQRCLVGSFSARFITTLVKMMIFDVKWLEEDHNHDHADHCITWFLQAT